MEVIRAFIFCVLVSFVHGIVNWQIINNDHLALGEATALLTRKYFSPKSNTLVIIERSFHSRMRFLNTCILDHILTNLQEKIAVQLYNGRSQNQPWEYHIFIVDSIQAFDKVKWSFPKTHYERDFHFLIVLTKYTPDYLRTVKRIFESCHRFRVYNANIILNHPLDGVSMFKYDLFTKFKCDRVQPYLYFRFKDGLHNLRTVFPRRLLNFYGCPLRITARLNSPILTFSGNHDNPVFEKDWESLSGIDGELIKIISHRLNFTINLIPIPKEYSLHKINSTHGCFSDLLEDRADMAIGGFSGSHPSRHILTPSIIYYHNPVVFVVRGGRELDSISRLARPFSRDVWKRLGICLLSVTFALFLLRFTNTHSRNFIIGQWNRTPILNFLTVFLGYPMTRLPVAKFARYLLGLWLLMSLIIRNAYQGSLFDAFRTDKFIRVPDDYDILVQWGYKLLGTMNLAGLEVFPENQTIPLYRDNYGKLEVLDNTHGHFTTVALLDNFLYYLAQNYQNGTKLTLIGRTVYLHSAVIYFQKHSIYTTPINRFLRYFKYAGLINHISSNHVKNYLLFKFYGKKGYIPHSITTFRIHGVFEICTALLVMATVVFLLEVLSVYWGKLKLLIGWIN